jgi:threonine 3-dehydrogenase
LVIASVLDAFGNAVHATNKVPLRHNTVLVTGCGPIGLMAIVLAKLSRARLILATDISKYRLDLAIKMGADFVIEPREDDIKTLVRQKTGEDAGVDILLEMSGNANALKQGFRMLRSGGQAVLMGLPKELIEFDFTNDLITKCISVYGITGRVMFKTWEQAQKLLRSCQSSLTSIITHRFLVDEFEKGIELMHSGKCGKVILFMDEESIRRSYTELPSGI